MTLTIQNAPDTSSFLDALKNFLSQWQGVKIETGKELVPNAETLEAIGEIEKEYEYMKTHPDEFKAYDNVDEMFEDIFADEV